MVKAIEKRLGQRRLFYVCRDIERAAGLRAKNYFIVANHGAYAAKLARQDSNVILIKEKNQLDTVELLKHQRAKQTISKNDFILVFKNSSLIENICQKNGWRLLNPDAKLADKIESKISQIEWLGDLAKYLPPRRVDICQNIKWLGKPFILQFNHSHTGSGTLFINTKKKLNELALKFPQRAVRVSQYINGPVFTNNNVVWENKILIGNINYQITGLSPFTDNKFATIGNDWSLPAKLLNHKQTKRYEQIAKDVGKKLSRDGWKGLFGVDIIMDEKSGRLYLLEINARQPASTTFESQLQQKSEIRNPKSEITTFEAHIASLLGLPYQKQELVKISDGAQIIQRVTKKITKIQRPEMPYFIRKKIGITNIIRYNNTLPGSDLIRFQFNKGLMEKHDILNALGKKIPTTMI